MACKECVGYAIAGSPELACTECQKLFASGVVHSAESFVALCEDLCQLGDKYSERDIAAAGRVIEQETTALTAAFEQATETRKRRGLPAASASRTWYGDELLGGALVDILDTWDTSEWFDLMLSLELAQHVADRPNASVYALLKRVLGKSTDNQLLRRWLGKALLGHALRPSYLDSEPFRTRLKQLSAMSYFLALSRIAALADCLARGLPPQESFTEEERSLYRRVIPVNARRFRRAFWFFHRQATFAKNRGDISEELEAIWVINPIRGPIRRYLPLIFEAAIDERDAEAVILCRAVIERAVATAARSLAIFYTTVNQGIAALETAGAISRQGAKKCRTIWSRGNKVVHEDPDFVHDSREVVRFTVEVLHELQPVLG